MMDKNIGSITRSKICRILAEENVHKTRRELAELERGLGKSPGELPDLWGYIFEDFPEEYMSPTGDPSREELAYYTALTLFSMHQRGHDTKTNPMHKDKVSLGQAVRILAGPDTKSDSFDRIRKRFNICVSAPDIYGLSTRLRGLVQQMKRANIPLDYGKLANDLYFYQIPGQTEKVRLRWGQDFYRPIARAEGKPAAAGQPASTD